MIRHIDAAHRASRRRVTGAVCAAIAAAVLVGGATARGASADTQPVPSWQRTALPSTTLFKGLSAVSSHVVWLGGDDGTVWRTIDGGRNWADVSPPGADGLAFYDVQGFSARKAVAMSAGRGRQSRLYVTGNGGRTWRLTYTNDRPGSYFDCMAFYDSQHGLLVGDPSFAGGGKFRILSTSDGGHSWTELPDAGLPPSRAHEYAFATSGECLTTLGTDAWFGTGGFGGGRVFHSADGGLTWDVTTTPVAGHTIGGIFGIAFRTPQIGIAVGGHFVPGVRTTGAAAITSGGGVWRSPAVFADGIRAGIAFLPGSPGTAITVGLTGSDISYDDGEHWMEFDPKPYYTTTCAPDGSCWAAGDNGRVARLRT